MRRRVTYGHEEPEPEPGVRWVELGDGLFAKVDEQDWGLVKAHKWFLSHGGTPATQYRRGDRSYTRIQLKVMILMKRAKKGQAIKNLDGDPLNCRRANLKLMSLSEARALDKEVLGPVERKKRKKGKRLPPPPSRPKPKFRLFES